MRAPLVAVALALAGAAGSGCQTAVGTYFANRARDLGECVRVEAGGALGLGVDVQAGGLLEFPLEIAAQPFFGGIGWTYGEPWATAGVRSSVFRAFRYIDWPLGGGGPHAYPHLSPAYDSPRAHFWSEGFSTRVELHGDEVHARGTWWLLPGLLRRRFTEPPPSLAAWHLIPRAWDQRYVYGRWDRVHAWDIEVGATLGLVYARVGFSPGEFLDFLLGWFGVDIAGDDRATLGR